MGNQRFYDTDELDKAIAESVEKLVDEETSVARAFVESKGDGFGTSKDVNLGKTQDLSDVARSASTAARNTRVNVDETDKGTRTRTHEANKGSRAKNGGTAGSFAQSGSHISTKKKNKMLLAVVAGVLLCAVILMAVLSVVINNSNDNSYDYNYSKGLEAYNSGNYNEAVSYFEKASSDSSGRKNIELKLKLYECYVSLDEQSAAADVLKDILNYDKYNEKALSGLAQYYSDKKDGSSLSELIEKYVGTDGEKYLKSYEVDVPTASEVSGKYTQALELELKSVNFYRIYYTVDGSQATTASNLYSEPIRIEKGNTTVKAIAVNTIGTVSSQLELAFEIDYKNPDSPVVTPATGSYASDTKISISNIPEGGKAYYTLDGSTPTDESAEYTDSISMPEGNIVFSAIIIDSNGMASSVTKRNYNVGVTTKYSYDEAIEHLKVVMIAKEDLNRDGTSADGGTAKFTYYRKTSIANVEMYIAFYDIIKNGVTTRQDYYFGVDISTGKCYKVYDQGGALIATDY